VRLGSVPMSSDRVVPPLSSPARPAPRRGVRAAAVTAAVVLGLAACGNAGETAGNPDLEPITVEGAYGEQPTIEFEAPFELEESASEVLSEGDGEEIAEGDTVTIDYSIVSGADGSELDTSFGATSVSLPLAEGQTTPGLIDALVGATIGSRVLVAVAPDPAAVEADPAAAETIVFVLDLLGIVPDRADGEEVDVAEGLPTVQTDDEGNVTGLDVEGVEAPEELVVTTVLQGDGDEVQAGDTVTIHYEGVLASDGSVFDSSWQRDAPTTFPLGGLIPGWQQGLEGVATGSRVVLQIPPELAYEDDDQNEAIPPNSDLVFVIDVLATQRGSETQ
jgi:peptidylprolyl isomerase